MATFIKKQYQAIPADCKGAAKACTAQTVWIASRVYFTQS